MCYNYRRGFSFGAFLLLLRTNVIDKRFHSYFFQTQYYRNTIKEIGGTMPEDLPTPKKSLKQLEKELKD